MRVVDYSIRVSGRFLQDPGDTCEMHELEGLLKQLLLILLPLHGPCPIVCWMVAFVSLYECTHTITLLWFPIPPASTS